jgi:hypothetical protein
VHACQDLFSPQKRRKIFHAHLAIAKDLVQQSRAYRFTRVNRHYRASSVVMGEETMTPAYTSHIKTGPAQSCNQLIARYTRVSAHAAIVMR